MCVLFTNIDDSTLEINISQIINIEHAINRGICIFTMKISYLGNDCVYTMKGKIKNKWYGKQLHNDINGKKLRNDINGKKLHNDIKWKAIT